MFGPSQVHRGNRPAALSAAWFPTSAPSIRLHDGGNASTVASATPCRPALAKMKGEGRQPLGTASPMLGHAGNRIGRTEREQGGPIDLASGCARYRVHEHHAPRHFVIGEMLPAPGRDASMGVEPRGTGDDRADDFVRSVVRAHPDDDDLLDAVERREDALDFCGIDFAAPDIDDPVHAAQERELAALPRANVTCLEASRVESSIPIRHVSLADAR